MAGPDIVERASSSPEQWARDAAIYERILAQMGDGVISLDLAGRIITFNRAAGVMLGQSPESAAGRPYAELFFAEERFDGLNELVLQAIADTSRTHSAEILMNVGDEERHFLVTTSFLETFDGQQKIGIIVVLHDVTARHKRRRLKRLFGAYLDPRIVERLLDRTVGMERGAREVMTVSFLDLQGFSGIAERLDAVALLDFLNAYLSIMSQPIGAERGVTDKYIGDGIMAFWGPPFTSGEEHAPAACAAALAQRRRVGELQDYARDELGLPETVRVDMRAGIATGELVAGSLGPVHARAYTVVGDVVNLAARLESANKQFGTRLMVSESTMQGAGARFAFRPLDQLRVRGRARPEQIFELVGESSGLPPRQVELLEMFERALADYRRRNWHRAAEGFARCLELVPDDRPSACFLGRATSFIETPPPAKWDGAWPVPGSDDEQE